LECEFILEITRAARLIQISYTPTFWAPATSCRSAVGGPARSICPRVDRSQKGCPSQQRNLRSRCTAWWRGTEARRVTARATPP